jgi:hypothetical protein
VLLWQNKYSSEFFRVVVSSFHNLKVKITCNTALFSPMAVIWNHLKADIYIRCREVRSRKDYGQTHHSISMKCCAFAGIIINNWTSLLTSRLTCRRTYFVNFIKRTDSQVCSLLTQLFKSSKGLWNNTSNGVQKLGLQANIPTFPNCISKSHQSF